MFPFANLNHQPSLLDGIGDGILQQICLSLQGAIEIDIPQSRAKVDWDVHNQDGTFAWNEIYTRLLRNKNLATFPSKSSAWEMVFAYDKRTGFLIGFMKEKRFAELQAKQPSRRRMHYIDALAKTFNAELSVAEPQLSWFDKQFEDEEEIGERVANLLQELDSDAEYLSHFAMVLFDSRSDEVLSIRMVLVNPNLEIVAQTKLNSQLHHEVLPIVEMVPAAQTPAQNPGRNLHLKSKAQQRKKRNLHPKSLKEEHVDDFDTLSD